MTAQQHLDELASTWATIGRLLNDIDPQLCGEHDLARLQIAGAHLDSAEDMLSAVYETSAKQEDEDGKFPFEAWDMVGQQPVTVVGWYAPNVYQLSDGTITWLSSITTVFPRWYLEAQQRQADEADQRDTEDAVRYGGCQ